MNAIPQYMYMNTYTDLKLFKVGQFNLANFWCNFVTLSKANLALQRKTMESNYQGQGKGQALTCRNPSTTYT